MQRSDSTSEYINICITDIDSCLLTNASPVPREDSLCQNLIDNLKKDDYAGYYICTHRCVKSGFIVTLNDEALGTYANLPNFNPYNTFLTNIVEAFEKATGLKRLGISTSDDQSFNNELSKGFERCIEPYEAKLKKLNADLLHAKGKGNYQDISLAEKNSLSTAFPTWFKNDELESIMRHAVKQFPGKKIRFHFFDDALDICQEALCIPLAAISPAIELRVYRHVSYHGINAQLLGVIQPHAPQPAVPMGCFSKAEQKLTLFQKPAVTEVTQVAVESVERDHKPIPRVINFD